MTPTEQQNAALAAFVACVVKGLNPTLSAHSYPQNGESEYDVLIGGRGLHNVILHEDIEAVLQIARDHGGRAMVDTEVSYHPGSQSSQGRLSIVWPGPTPSGPDPQGEHDQQANQGRRASRKPAAKKAKRSAAA